MRENRFIFIIPFYNVRDYITECVNSILNQKYKNWIAIFCDDSSTDGTSDLIPEHPQFIKRVSSNRSTALENIHNNLINSDFLDENDIIIVLDGDDFIINNEALNLLDSIYNINRSLVTYGQYIFPNGTVGHCNAYNGEEFSNLRTTDWRASHLRTFKWKVYQEIIKQDSEFNCFKDDNSEFYKSCYDIALMFPLMEIAGYRNTHFNPVPLYFYRIHQFNDHNVNAPLQKGIEQEIRKKKKFNQVF